MTLMGVASTAPSRRAWIAVALAWIVSVALLLAWVLGTPTGTLREQLASWQFWSLESCLFLGLLIGAVMARDLWRGFQKADGLRMAALAIVALGLTLFVAPRTNRIFYDEQIYQAIGQSLADARLAQVCNDGSVEYGRLQCASGEYNKQPYAYPHALSVAYRLFGVRAGTAFGFNAAVMAATACGVYLFVCLLFRDRDAALFAGLLLTLTPHQVIWSATAAVEPSASLACVIAFVAAACYLRRGGSVALVGVVVATAYAVQFRPESVLMMPILGGLMWPRLRLAMMRPGGWWAGLLLLLLLAVHVAHLFAIRHAEWGTSEARFSFEYVAGNLAVNGRFYLYDERFPAVFTLLAIAGLCVRRAGAERLVVACYFLAYFAIDLVFYAGSYNYGADVRYSVMTYPPIAILGGLGAARLAALVARIRPGVPAHAVVVVALAFQFLWYAPVVRATTEEAWAARADVEFAKALAADLPRNAYVLTHNPGMFHLWGKNAGQMALVNVTGPYLAHLERRYAGGVYVHWNFWCNTTDPTQQELCRKAMTMAPMVIVREYRERDQRFALYRINRPPM